MTSGTPAPCHLPPSLHLAVNLRWCQSVCQSRQCPLRGNPLPPHPKKSDIVQLWECLVWRQRGVSGRNSVRPDEAASSLAPCSCDRCNLVNQGVSEQIKVLRHAPPCLLSNLLLHKAAPGHHDPLAHLLPLPHHGTRGYAKEGTTLTVNNPPSCLFAPWGILPLSFDYLPAQFLINVYEQQRGRTFPLKIRFRASFG